MKFDRTFGERICVQSYTDRPGAYLIAVEQDKIATVRTSKGNFLLGGGIENQESRQACIKRECLEEIGFEVTVGLYLCCAETFCEHETIGYFHPMQYYYSGRLNVKKQEPIEADHTFEWINIHEIDKKMYFEMQRWAIKCYLDRYTK